MTEVLLISMPFGPLMSPSLGLSLLQPQVRARGLTSRIEYLTLRYAERIGQELYSKIATEQRAMSRAFVGEWIFSHALFDWSADHDERYLREVLLTPPSWLGRNPSRPPSLSDLRAVRRAIASVGAFVDEWADRLAETTPRIIGFSSVFQQHCASLAMAKRLKARCPEALIVMGGANCESTMGVETLRQFPFVDAIVSGEGDLAFPELAVRVVCGEAIDTIPGVVTPKKGSGLDPFSGSIDNLDALPFPDYTDFFDQFRATRFDRQWQPSVFVETSRGCWWGERMHCTFCGLNGATMTYRSKSAPRALEEIEHLVTSYPGCDIQVVDNILDLKYFKTLLPDLAARKLPVSLFYETKSNLKKEQVRMLRDAGVTAIQPGIESFSDNVLKQMKKGVTGLQNIQLLKWCKEIGVQPIWNFLLGFPQESPDDYQRMADLAARVCHLPHPSGVTAIRLDRFSPNFTQSDQLGFTKVRPLPFYEFIYDVPEDARRNLAYYFSYDYKAPQDVARYAQPLVEKVHAWRTTWRHAELLSVDVDSRLHVFDTRPRGGRRRPAVSTLVGAEREAYLACDAIAEASQLDPAHVPHLRSLTDRGLMINEGSRYLSLAVPVGDYQPSRAAAARLRPLFAHFDRRDRRRVKDAFRVP
jgi:ribosomal peptide maturation radical SAM protein 1